MDLTPIIFSILQIAFTIVAQVFNQSLNAVQFGLIHYPLLTRSLFIILFTYLGLRFIIRTIRWIVRLWLNFIIFTLKIFLTMFAISFAFAIYIRGARFVTSDIPFIFNWILRKVNTSYMNSPTDFDFTDFTDNIIRNAYSMGSSSLQNLFTMFTDDDTNAKFYDDNVSYEFTNEAFDYLKDRWDSEKFDDFVRSGVSHLQDFLQNQYNL